MCVCVCVCVGVEWGRVRGGGELVVVRFSFFFSGAGREEEKRNGIFSIMRVKKKKEILTCLENVFRTLGR